MDLQLPGITDATGDKDTEGRRTEAGRVGAHAVLLRNAGEPNRQVPILQITDTTVVCDMQMVDMPMLCGTAAHRDSGNELQTGMPLWNIHAVRRDPGGFEEGRPFPRV